MGRRGPVTEPADATPLTDAERRGLLQPVLTRAELNLAEAANISDAMSWLFLSRRRLRPDAVTDEEWLKRLHGRMYGQVWAWAGRYRTADRNLGVPYWQIRLDMRECAIRFGYRLVVVHPFPNGNGRWSRLASDALIVALGGSRFSWGGGDALTEPGRVRRDYVSALRTADEDGDLGPLIAFSRR